MFTGIIECLGTIVQVQRQGKSVILLIRPDAVSFPVATGGSVAIDGACLTLEQMVGNEMRFCAVAETLHRTTLTDAVSGRRVNMERALIAGGRLDGHFVYGHVDGTGTIICDREAGGSMVRTISVPGELSRFMAEKGSVAVDGISLTIVQGDNNSFDISLIPHTLAITTMSLKKPGDTVNIECDIVARYLDRIISKDASAVSSCGGGDTLLNLMERSGF